MTCGEFVRWLDDGMPEGSGAVAARAHAQGCDSCAAAFAAARELDQLLEGPAPSAPASLTDSVMTRVVAIERLRAAQPRANFGAFAGGAMEAWWVRAAAQPAAALAFVLAALTLWQRDALNSYGGALIANTSGWLARALDTQTFAILGGGAATPGAAAALAKPEVTLGVALAIAPVVMMLSASLWRWAERRF